MKKIETRVEPEFPVADGYEEVVRPVRNDKSPKKKKRSERVDKEEREFLIEHDKRTSVGEARAPQ